MKTLKQFMTEQRELTVEHLEEAASWRVPRSVRQHLEKMYGPGTIDMGDGVVHHHERVLNDKGEDGYIVRTHKLGPNNEVGSLIKHKKPPKSFFKEDHLDEQELNEASLSEPDLKARKTAMYWSMHNRNLDQSGLRVGGLTSKGHPIHAAVDRFMNAREALGNTDLTNRKYPERRKEYEDAQAEVVKHGHELIKSEKDEKEKKKKRFPYGV